MAGSNEPYRHNPQVVADRQWQDAVVRLSVADRDGVLCGDDLDALAEALLWS